MSVREDVATQLEEYLATLTFADVWSDEAGSTSRMIHGDGELYSAERLEFHSELVDGLLKAQGPASKGRTLAVAVTAGPPGAGKSTAITRIPELKGFRHVDADDFKDALLIDARKSGLLDEWMTTTLADGGLVDLRELAGFVHAESTRVAETMRDRCLEAGENVIVHGTISSENAALDLVSAIDEFGYRKMTIIDVEVPQSVAIERAMTRWWNDRVDKAQPHGGRFVSRTAIAKFYPNGPDVSVCRANAALLGSEAKGLGWTVDLQHIDG